MPRVNTKLKAAEAEIAAGRFWVDGRCMGVMRLPEFAGPACCCRAIAFPTAAVRGCRAKKSSISRQLSGVVKARPPCPLPL